MLNINKAFVINISLLTLVIFTVFQAEQVVSYLGKTLLPLKTPPLHGERVAVTNLSGDTLKEEVNIIFIYRHYIH